MSVAPTRPTIPPKNTKRRRIWRSKDGSGIGVGTAQYGQRRGFYGTVAFDF